MNLQAHFYNKLTQLIPVCNHIRNGFIITKIVHPLAISFGGTGGYETTILPSGKINEVGYIPLSDFPYTKL